MPEVIKKVKPAVVFIITYSSKNKPLSQGSGFFIDKNGNIVTNYNVIKDAKNGDKNSQRQKIHFK